MPAPKQAVPTGTIGFDDETCQKEQTADNDALKTIDDFTASGYTLINTHKYDFFTLI